MFKTLTAVHPVLVLLVATLLEVSGDAVIRLGIYQYAGIARIGLFAGGAALLFGYGSFLNLTPFQFGQIAGLYIAVLFVVWQFINRLVFGAAPTLPILLGGLLIVGGGLIVAYWKPA